MEKKTLTKVIGLIISFFAFMTMLEIIINVIEGYNLKTIFIIKIVLLHPVLLAMGILMLLSKKQTKIFTILALVFVSILYILNIVMDAEYFEYCRVSYIIELIIGNVNVLEIGLLIINLILKDKSSDKIQENEVAVKTTAVNQETVLYLKQYKELLDAGAISEEEYNRLKGEILK